MEADPELKEKAHNITDNPEVFDQVEIQIKYKGYIEKEFEMAREMERKENMEIPENIDYHSIESLSTEGQKKLDRVKPETIGQAGRISGVSASDISVLMIYLKN